MYEDNKNKWNPFPLTGVRLAAAKNMPEAMGPKRENTSGKITSVGPIENFSAHGGGLWTGRISFDSTCAELGAKTVEKALAGINRFFVKADEKCASRCIDGRMCEHWREKKELQNRPLGPQTPGGTAHTALADSIIDVGASPKEHTFVKDFEKMIARYKKAGLAFGGHIDDHQHEGNTGCGAIDKVPQIFEKMLEPSFSQNIRPYLKAILGKDYKDSLVDSLLARASKLHDQSHEYFEKDASGNYAYKKKVIQKLESNGNKKTVEKLVGDHREVALVINQVDGTTFDRDAFSNANKNEIQSFNYDFWRSRKVAKKLYPGNAAKQKEFLTMRAMLGVATAMVLTDGTIHLLVREK